MKTLFITFVVLLVALAQPLPAGAQVPPGQAEIEAYDGLFRAAATGNVIQGNYIGVGINGTEDLGNTDDGIDVGTSAANNLIGGDSVGEGNVIGYNDGDGIEFRADASTGNTILGNSIFDNTGEGIDLSQDGVTANDVGDGDSGPNNLQNFPVLSSAETTGTSISITGSLNSTANSYYRIEFFANSSGDGTGYGEGQTYLGYVNVSTDGSGNATINANLSESVSAGSFISATATKSNASYTTFSDTSEFAQNTTATAAPDITSNLILHNTFDADATDSSGNNYDGTLTNGAFIDPTNATDRIGVAKLSLDGSNDFVDLSSNVANFSGLTEGTISGWIKTTGSNRTILSISDTADANSYAELFIGSSGYLTFEVYENGTAQLATYSGGRAPINDGAWHHVAVAVNSSGNKLASSTELVGEIVLWEAGEFMVEHGFVDFIGAESVRFSEGHFRFGVHALNAAAGELAFGREPVQQQLTMATQGARHFLEWFQLAAHRSRAPVVQESAGPGSAAV